MILSNITNTPPINPPVKEDDLQPTLDFFNITKEQYDLYWQTVAEYKKENPDIKVQPNYGIGMMSAFMDGSDMNKVNPGITYNPSDKSLLLSKEEIEALEKRKELPLSERVNTAYQYSTQRDEAWVKKNEGYSLNYDSEKITIKVEEYAHVTNVFERYIQALQKQENSLQEQQEKALQEQEAQRKEEEKKSSMRLLDIKG
jgi:hypothetical protein